MAAGTLIRQVLLRVTADDGDTEAKLDAISAKAKELGEQHPELQVRIDTAAATAKVAVLREELKSLGTAGDVAGAEAGDGILAGLASREGLIGAGVVTALAGLPAIAAAGGATAGIALGAALLIGSSKVKGPLYDQFHSLTQGLLGEMRTAALPLVKPLGDAFTQIGKDAQQLKPELTEAFADAGPAVMPLTQGLEGLVSGAMPGFLALMRQSGPAMRAVDGVLTELGTDTGKLFSVLARPDAIAASDQALGGLGKTVGGLLPFVGKLADITAETLAPVMSMLGGKVVPGLTGTLGKVLGPLEPTVVQFGDLAANLLGVGTNIANNAGPGLSGLAGFLNNTLAPALSKVNGLLSLISGNMSGFTSIPGMGLVGFHFNSPPSKGGTSSASVSSLPSGSSAVVPGLGGPADPTPPAPSTPSYSYSVPSGYSAWASGLTGADIPSGSGYSAAQSAAKAAMAAKASELGNAITQGLGSGVKESVPQAETEARKLAERVHTALMSGQITTAQANKLVEAIDNQLQNRANRAAAEATKLGQQLNSALVKSISSSSSTDAVKTAVSKLIDDVTAAYQSGLISLDRDQAVTKQLDVESTRLQQIEQRRTAIANEINTAKSYAASTASNANSAYSFSDFATGNGPGNGPQSGLQIITSLRGDLVQVRQFGTNIKKLAKMGLNKSYLQQLIAMGPVQGGPLAQELAGTALSDISTINKYEYEINQASGQLGKTAGNVMYDAGAKGFLSGLEAQQAQINKVFAAASKNMVTQLRKELGIKNGKQTLELQITGGTAAFRTFLKNSIRVTGGNVSVVGS